MSRRPGLALTALLRYVLAGVGLAFVGVYVAVAIRRMGFPFELEWMEGGTVDHIRRILSGQRLYVPPSLAFVPYIYPPVYFYAAAGLAAVVGVGFLPLRLISFVSSVGSLVLVLALVRRETGSTTAAICASSLFAATYRLSGAWFDIARVDSLFLLLLLLGIYYLRYAASPRSHLLAGLFISLAFMTKQIAAMIALPLIAYVFVEDRRHFAYFIAVILVVAGLGSLILDRIHDGWFLYYIYRLPKGHGILQHQFSKFWLQDLLRPLPIACALAGLALYSQLRNGEASSRLFYPLLTVGMLGGAWFSRLHSGGYSNVLFPAYAVISILAGLGLGRLLKTAGTRSGIMATPAVAFLIMCCLVQFALLRYDPGQQIPSEADRVAGNQLITMIARIQGEVLMPDHGYLARLAGKQTCAHRMAIYDVCRGDDGDTKTALIEEIREAARQKRFAAIILDSPWRQQDLKDHYQPYGPIFPDETVFWPVTGKHTRPTYFYLPK